MACYYLEETETLSLEFPIGSLLVAATACLDRFIYDGLEHRLHVLSALNVPSQETVFSGLNSILKVCVSFLVWQIHKPIAGVVGSHIGALQPGKVDNQCVEKIPLFVFCWMERRPPTVGRYLAATLAEAPQIGPSIRLFAVGRYPAPEKSGRRNEQD